MTAQQHNQATTDTMTPWVSLSVVMFITGIIAFTTYTTEYVPAPAARTATVHQSPAKGPTLTFDNAAQHARKQKSSELEQRFQQAVAMLHAKRYEFALPPLHRVIELAPEMPEAYVNMGFALIGLERYETARDFFQTAIDLRPYQGNAYWGLAVALENIGDISGALGAMRTYIHLAEPNDPYVRRARSALWEWEYKLERGPLPEAEAKWLKRRGKEWEERNSPERDMPQPESETIPISVSPID